MKPDIYQHKIKVDNKLKDIGSSRKLTEGQKGDIKRFANFCLSAELSLSRVNKYLYHLNVMAEILGKGFREATRDDIERVIIEIKSRNYSISTLHDYKVTIKKFYKWLEGNNEDYPEKVRWVRTNFKEKDRIMPESLLTQQEIRKLIDSATTLRDKALISTLYEAGIRVGELLTMRIRSVDFDEYGAMISVTGKTGHRRIRLVNSLPYLSNWIAHHPKRNNPDSFLWVSIGSMNHNELICYNTVRKMLGEVAEKANVKKRINPHSFRHARATFLCTKLTDAQMCKYFGWRLGSEAIRTYIHLSGRETDDAILKLHGIVKNDNNNGEKDLEPRECPRCTVKNEPENSFCSRCGLPLTEKAALEAKKREKEAMEFLNSEDILEKMIDRKVREMLNSKVNAQ